MSKFKIVVILSFTFLLSFVMTACDGGGQPQQHTCQYTTKTIDPTCTEQGYTQYFCQECGNSYNDNYVPAKGHSFGEWETKVPATEDQTGLEVQTCQVCGHSAEQEIPRLDHTHKYSSEWSFNENQHWYAATCGHADLKANEEPHKFVDFIEEVQEGEYIVKYNSFYCTDCQYIKRGEHECEYGSDYEYDALTHWYPSTCGHGQKDSAPHTFTEYREIEVEGEYVIEYLSQICECGYSIRGEHTHNYYSMWSISDTHHWYAPICGHQDAITYYEHDYTEWEIISEPTETEEGLRKASCMYCGYEKEETIPVLEHIHKYEDNPTNNETHHWHNSTCGHDVKLLYEEHDYFDWIVRQNPTETEEGWQNRFCKYCNYEQIEIIPVLEHTHKYESEYSYDSNYHWYKSTCGHDVVDDYNLHYYTNITKKIDPTNTTAGELYGVCLQCSYRGIIAIPALDEVNYTIIEYIVEPNCSTVGRAVYQMTINGETVDYIGEAYSDKHTYEDGVCTQCGEGIVNVGFEYQLSSDGEYYILVSVGTNKDAEIAIPTEYQGLPVRYVGVNAFKDCTHITYVLIPQDVYVLEGAFSGCSNITEMNLGRGSYFDIYDNNYSYPIGWIFGKEQYEESYKVTQNSIQNNNLKSFDFYVPKGLKKITFTGSLSNRSLQGFSSVEEVVLTKDTYIPQYAFSGCSNLSEINLENITYIDDYGFYGCSSLDVEYILTAPLVKLGGRAIANCKLTSTHLNIPEAVKSLGFGVFEGLTSIEELTINGLCDYYETFSTLFGVTGVETAPVYNLKKITIRDPHVYGSSAFELPDNVEELILHEDSVILVYGALSGINIYNVYEKGYYIGTEDNPYHFLVSASTGVIHKDCKVIAGGAFRYSDSITSIVIPETIEEITVGALNGLSNIEEISLPFIGANLNGEADYVDLDGKSFGFVFASYSYTNSGIKFNDRIPDSIRKVHINNANFWNATFYNAKGLEEVTADNVLYQGSYVYGGCSNLHTATFGNVSMAGSYFSTSSFDNSVKISQRYWKNNMVEYEDYYIPASLRTIYIKGTIYTDAFYDFECVENIIISNCTEIGESSLSSFQSLKTITIEDGVTTIGDSAFAYCTSLTEVNLSQSVETIGENAFINCTSLEEINLPNSLSSLGNNVFKGCTNLKDVTINGNITSIGADAFLDCTELENVYINISFEDWCNINFENKYSNPMCYAKNIYFTDENGELVEVTEIDLSDVEADALLDNKLMGMNKITKLILPYAPKFLGSLFGGEYYTQNESVVPTSLETVVITGGDNVPQNAFYGCTSIKEFILSNTIKTIHVSAFENCSSVEELVIPDSVENIYISALKGCTNLTNLTIPFIGDDKDDPYYKDLAYIFGSSTSGIFPTSLTNVTVSGNVVIRANSFEGFNDITYLDLSNASLIEADALVGCTNLEYLGIANPQITNNNISLGMLFGATSFNQNTSYVPTTLKTLRIDNTEKLWNNLGSLVSLDTLYLGKNISTIADTFNGMTVGNVYFEGTIEDWLNIYAIYVASNPNYVATNFYVLNEEGDYYKPTSLSLSKEKIGYEIFKFTAVKELYIDSTVKEFNSSFTGYELDKIYYNGTLSDWVKLTFSWDTSNPAQYAKEFYYKDINDQFVLFDGEVVLDEGVTELNNYSLYFANLTKVVLPETIKSVNSKAFLNVDNLTFNVYDNAKYLGSKNNPYMLLFKASSTDITSVEIHEDTKIISTNAFKDCNSLIEVVVPDGVENIERNAFNTNSIEKITLPITNMEDVDSNGNAYFSSYFVASSAVTNKIPTNLKTVVVTSTPTIKMYYFSSCSSITSLTLPEDVEYEIYAFNGLGIATNEYKNAYYIGSITNPYMILYKGIDNTATTFEMHPDTTKVVQGALAGFDSLEELTINFLPDNTKGSNYLGVLFYDNRYVVTTNGYVPSTLQTVKVLSGEFSKYTFKNLSITNLYINKNCTSVDDFGGFTSLTNVYFDGTLADWFNFEFTTEKSTPMYYASNFYIINENQEYEAVEELIIPEEITVLGNYQFMNFGNLKSLVIPNTVESIGEKVFAGCNSLVSLEIPYVGDATPLSRASYLFGSTNQYGNDNTVPTTLVKLTITGNVEEASYYRVFGGFNRVTDLYISKNVKLLYGGFGDLSALENVYYEGTLADWLDVEIPYQGGNPMYNGEHFFVYDEENEVYNEITELDLTSQNTIGSYQFYGFDNVTKLIIVGGTTIGTGAFTKCNIKELEFVSLISSSIASAIDLDVVETLKLNSVVTLNQLPAFNNLQTLYLPATISYVNNDAFSSCTYVAEIYYDGTVEDWCNISFSSTEANPLAHCDHFYYKDGDDYKLFDNISVDFEIGMFQFAGSKDLTTLVVLENGYLSDYSLYNCSNLKQLTLTLETQNLNMYFVNNLGEGSVPNGLTLTLLGSMIKDYGLASCNFDKVYISSTITEFGKSTFKNSTINNLYYDGTLTEWYGITLNDEYSNPYSVAKEFYVKEDGEYVLVESLEIPTDIDTIKAYQFANCAFTSLEIPSSVKTIEANAFMNCTRLTEIVIPSTVETVKKGAFSGCNNVVKVTLPFIGESREKALAATTSSPVGFQELFGYSPRLNFQGAVKEVVLTEGTIIPAAAFNNCRLIEKITLPESIVTISNQAFMYCESLQSISIPDGVTEIQTYAFSRCTGLKELHVPSLAVVQENAFQYCQNLEELTLPNVNPKEVTTTTNKNSDNFDNIMYYFDTYTTSNFSTYLPNLTTLNIVGDVSSNQNNKIVVRAFEGATNLTTVNLKNLYLVDDYAFTKCINLTSVTFENVRTLDVCAFQNCTELTELSLSGVTSYKTMVFNGCTKVTDLVVDTGSSVSIKAQLHTGPYNTITVINGSGASFSGTTIDTITFEDTATSIGLSAFDSATITNMYLPKTLTSISLYAFDDASITNLYYDGTIEDWMNVYNAAGENLFNSVTNFYFKEDSEYVLSSNYTSIYYTRAEMLSGTFAGFSSIKEVLISKDVTAANQSTFTDNSIKFYYEGTEEEWKKVRNWSYINGTNSGLKATVYYYRESAPITSNKYWHYVDGEYVVWTNETTSTTYTLVETTSSTDILDPTTANIYQGSSVTLYNDGTFYYDVPGYKNYNGTIMAYKGYFIETEDDITLYYDTTVYLDGSEYKYSTTSDNGAGYFKDNQLYIPIEVYQNGGTIIDILYGIYVPVNE